MLNVTTDNEDSEGFLSKVMSPIYEKCANVTGNCHPIKSNPDIMLMKCSGKNLHTIRSTLLKDAISKGEPFNTICPGIKGAIEGEIEKRQPSFMKDVQAIFEGVIADFKSLFIIEEKPDPSRDILRSQIEEFVHQAHAKINGPIATELGTAMSDSKG